MFIFVVLMMALPFMQQNGIEIKDAWIRPGAKDMNTALYFEIFNHTDKADTLYDVKSSLAQKVEVHETYMKGDMMGMRPVKAAAVEANSGFKFQPGGHHVMFINLRKSLKKGSSGEVTLYFRHAGEIKIKPEVRK
ncbi:MAG: copper chaperone PCu(A)C [Syntrophomonadaceae bacterium]